MAASLKIFISSTYKDLWDYRQGVISQLQRMRHVPYAMEDMGSREVDPVRACMDEIRECDVFIGIYAFRYGYSPDEGGPSITEMEYEHARSHHKRCLCYFADDSLAPETTDEGVEKQAGLEALKKRINKELVRSIFTSPDDLAKMMAADIARIDRGDPLGFSLKETCQQWMVWEMAERKRIVDEELYGHPNLVASPLAYEWSKFISAKGWHLEIRESVDALMHDCEGIGYEANSLLDKTREAIKTIDENGNYDLVQARLAQVLAGNNFQMAERVIKREARDPDRDDPPSQLYYAAVRAIDRLRELKRLAENPTYRRCFFITGEIGAGKTHFCASLLADPSREELADREYLVLWLRPQTNKPLQDLILEKIRVITQGDWRSLDEFSSFLEGSQIDDWVLKLAREIDAERAELRWRDVSAQELNEKIVARAKEITGFEWESADEVKKHRAWVKSKKLVVVLDDVQSALLPNPTLEKSKLMDSIAGTTSARAVHWLLTIPIKYYDLVADRQRFWFKYSHFESREQGREITQSNHIDGWQILDTLNQSWKTGIKMFKAWKDQALEIQKAYPFEEDELFILEHEQTERALKYLNNPLIAWVLIEWGEKNSIKTIVDLNFIAFIGKYWEKQKEKLNFPRAELLDDFVDILSNCLLKSKDFSPEYTQLVNEIISQSTLKSIDFQSLEACQEAFDALERANLAKRERTSTGTISEMRSQERVLLNFETFWEYYVAWQLLAAEKNNNVRMDAIPGEVEDWFLARESQQMKEGILEFVLLLLDEYALQDEWANETCRPVWSMGLVSQHVPETSVWFAGPKSRNEQQTILKEWLSEHETPRLSGRALFAFMFFIWESNPLLFEPHERLELLQPHFTAIQDANLSLYFSYYAKKLILSLDTADEIYACMNSLTGCEVMEIQEELARIVIYQLQEVLKDEEKIGKYLIRYFLQAQSKIPPKTGPWQRTYFCEWLMNHYCSRVVWVFGIDAYPFFKRINWYNPRGMGIEFPVSLFMEQEANITIGSIYQVVKNKKEKKSIAIKSEFISFVGRLLDRKLVDRRNAFYIILHTEVTQGNKEVQVDECFYPMLRRIEQDPQLSKIVNRYRRMFDINLRKAKYRR